LEFGSELMKKCRLNLWVYRTSDATWTPQQKIILFSTENKMKIISYRQFFLKNHTMVKKAEIVGDSMSFMVLRGFWCDTVQNAHASAGGKSDGTSDKFCEVLEELLESCHVPHDF
jgi:hypothetical protein